MMPPPLTPAIIRTTLTTVKAQTCPRQPTQAAMIAPDLWQTYQRILQVYALTRLGKIDAQKAAIQVRQQRQRVNLRNEFSQMSPAQWAQELAELDAAIAWQLAQLEQVDLASEAAVKACEIEIEAWLTQLRPT